MKLTKAQAYHVYDPGYGEEPLSVHESVDDALTAANETIDNNWRPDFGEEWSTDVTDICVVLADLGDEDFLKNGQLIARAKAVDVEHRPADTDDDGWSESASDWWPYGSCESACNYRVEIIAALKDATHAESDDLGLLLEKAIRIAVTSHEGQVDKAGRPYILHPLRVMAAMDTDAERIVAALHDLLEDCPDWTFTELLKVGFPGKLVQSISLLTKPKHQDYDEYIKFIAGDPVARKVKLADLADNMDLSRLPGAPTPSDLARQAKYARARKALGDT